PDRPRLGRHHVDVPVQAARRRLRGPHFGLEPRQPAHLVALDLYPPRVEPSFDEARAFQNRLGGGGLITDQPLGESYELIAHFDFSIEIRGIKPLKHLTRMRRRYLNGRILVHLASSTRQSFPIGIICPGSAAIFTIRKIIPPHHHSWVILSRAGKWKPHLYMTRRSSAN